MSFKELAENALKYYEDYLSEVSIEIREKYLEKFLEYIDGHYINCLDYIQNYESAGLETTWQNSKIVQAIYSHIKSYQGYTNEQLEALSRLSNPVTDIYDAYKNLAHGGGKPDQETINQAIDQAAKSVKVINNEQIREGEIDYEDEFNR